MSVSRTYVVEFSIEVVAETSTGAAGAAWAALRGSSQLPVALVMPCAGYPDNSDDADLEPEYIDLEELRQLQSQSIPLPPPTT